MSFSSDVKEELARIISNSRHCSLAELSAIIGLNGKLYFNEKNDEYTLRLTTENIGVARKYFTIIKKTFNIVTDISIKNNVYLKKTRTYTISINNHKDTRRILQATKFIDANNNVSKELLLQDKSLLMNSCCKRSFIRGAFISSGSISDPERFYHLEFVSSEKEKALFLQSIIDEFQIDAKIGPLLWRPYKQP